MRRKKRKSRLVLIVCLIVLVISVAVLAKGCSSQLVGTNLLPPLAGDSNNENNTSETGLLILVNKDNKLPDDYKVNLTKEGAQFARIMLDDFEDMMGAAASEKIYLYVRDAYRSKEEQAQISNDLPSHLAAPVGHSEHETGLAIDFSLADNAGESAKTWKWLAENAHEYGFILRYPEGKEQITGYAYEPWHYRYVGKEHAKIIYEKGLVLEEYLENR